MNINRNVLKIVAGVLLVASLPAGAQVLGGGLGGAANGAGAGHGIDVVKKAKVLHARRASNSGA